MGLTVKGPIILQYTAQTATILHTCGLVVVALRRVEGAALNLFPWAWLSVYVPNPSSRIQAIFPKDRILIPNSVTIEALPTLVLSTFRVWVWLPTTGTT